ncbi:ThiF family adenylyltransferase [Microbacterium gilvum]|uniref:ThiF family adenylyltransferase n=1 Tax=Microbacterium gilvum TaxID=1336204 RepID=A0ABP8ZUP3_9MICO
MPFPPLVSPMPALDPGEAVRTARHRALAAVGDEGQRRLAAAHVAVVGAGGLGSPAVLALAAAGVGTLTVIDDDVVELSNLQRQILHGVGDVGEPKVDSAVRAAAALAPAVRVVPVRSRLDAHNAATLLAHADVVLDGSDLFETRMAVADATEAAGIPLVWGTVQETAAQVTVFWSRPPAGSEPVVLADLFPPDRVGDPPSCAQVGVLGTLCLQIGALMATQAVALIAGIGEPLLGRVLLVDALTARHREVPLRGQAGAPPRDAAPTAVPSPPPASTVGELTAAQARTALAAARPPAVLDVREEEELASGTLPGAVHIPLGRVLADPAGAARAVGGGDVVVVCQAGVRARRAADALAPFAHPVVLAGGFAGWSTETRG